MQGYCIVSLASISPQLRYRSLKRFIGHCNSACAADSAMETFSVIENLMMTSLYEVLDVPRDCDAERLKDAFRKAVKVSHPDLNADDPGATARLRLIVRAKTVLSDPELRADYDRMLEFEQRQYRPFSSLAITLDAGHFVVLAVVLAGAYTLFSYISEAPVAKVQVSQDATHEPVNVVDVRSPPPGDGSTPEKSDNVEASVSSAVAPPTSNAVALEDAAPALDIAPTPTTVQESTGVADLPAPSPSRASAHATSESLDGSVPSLVASSSAVSVEGTTSAPSIAPRATEKAIAAIHSDGLIASVPVKDASFYHEQGIAAYHNGDVALAIADFNVAIQLNPNFKNAYIDRSIAFYRMRNFHRAFADIAQAVRIEKPRR
jgi:tetratricopeptide (TPR) repeat protein